MTIRHSPFAIHHSPFAMDSLLASIHHSITPSLASSHHRICSAVHDEMLERGDELQANEFCVAGQGVVGVCQTNMKTRIMKSLIGDDVMID